MNKNAYIILGLVFFAFSCRKEDVVVDREDNLLSDTSIVVYNANYQSHTPTTLIFTVDMLHLNGVQSQTSFDNFEFVDTSYVQNQTLTFGVPSLYNYPAISEYSTIILFDYNETDSYKRNYTGYFLRRFFEIADSLPNRHVALSSMSSEQNTLTRLHSQNPGDIFGNTWEYNVETFYKLTAHEDISASETAGLFIKGRINDLIDSLVAAPGASGDLSITFISGNGGYNFSNQSDIDEIIDKALLNNVKINIITPSSSGAELAYIANATGGFISRYVHDFKYDPLPEEEEFPNVQITLQNLDDLLMGNVFTYRVSAAATFISASTWQSGDYANLTIKYNNYAFHIGVRIP